MLEEIRQTNDIKKIPVDRLPALAEEIRSFLVQSVSRTGGHLASNLGVVELTMALHYVYDLPADRIIWDVGHQCYTHKILTGRKHLFSTLRQEGGISGFPRREEDPADCFDGGHSSSSISAGLGYVRARDLLEENWSVVSVIGDGALTGGMAYEAVNNASKLKSNFTIVLNDNEMSISPNVGGISDYLGSIRTSEFYTGLKDSVLNRLERIPEVGDGLVSGIRRTKSSIKHLMIPGMFFEDMGLTYLGPVDGHNIRSLIRVLQEARRFQGPVLVHVITQKGRGYPPAVRHPDQFHGTGAFHIETGAPVKKQAASYTQVFSAAVTKLAAERPDIVAVTAAMRDGTGLKNFSVQYPDRFFDVGIAEGHAVTFAAGMALGGLTPVLAVYSSFLQRGFDQIMDDICMQDLHVILAIDRAGLVGADGRTHQGAFDLTYLSMLPNMTVMAPKNRWELEDMLRFAADLKGPVAVRYPRGEAWTGLKKNRTPLAYGKAEVIKRGAEVAILAVGAMMENAMEAAGLLEEAGICATVVNVRFVKPFDRELLEELAEDHGIFLTVEENCRTGGFGSQVQDFVQERGLPVRTAAAAIPDTYIRHAGVDSQRRRCGLDPRSLVNRIVRLRQEEGNL